VDVGEMQRRLSHTAAQDPAHQFGDLYSLLCNEVWLRVAVHHVQQNKGSETAGIDGKNMSNFLGNFDGYIEELTTTLKAETFEPCPVRRVYIPKPNSEKKRPLGIPILFDRIVKEALRMILEPIWEQTPPQPPLRQLGLKMTGFSRVKSCPFDGRSIAQHAMVYYIM